MLGSDGAHDHLHERAHRAGRRRATRRPRRTGPTHNGCKGSTDEDVSDEVIHRTFDCPDGAAVEFYIIEGGGHSWPGSEFSKSIDSIVGPTTFDIDATDLIWTFFQRFRLPS